MENILASKLEPLIDWLIKNRIRVLTFIGAMIIVSLIGSVFFLRKKETLELNWTRLSQAQAYLSQNKLGEAREIFSSIEKESVGDILGLYASYYLGQVSLQEKKWDEAIKYFSIVKNSGNKNLVPLTLSNIGYAYEQQQNFKEAAITYQTFITSYSDHYMAARIQKLLGENQILSGDIEAGKKTLGNLIDLYPTSNWAENSRRLLDKLQAH